MAMIKKSFLVEKLLSIVILFRISAIPIWMHTLLILVIFIVKFNKEGFRFTTLLYMIAGILTVLGQYVNLQWVNLTGLVMVIIINFLPYNVYHLPIVKPFVGFKANNIGYLFICQFYPLKQENPQQISTPWNIHKQLKRMYESVEHQIKVPYKLFSLIMSYVNNYNIYVGRGQEKQTKELIVFSHGKGATPFYYSTLLMKLAQNRKIVAVQHSQIPITNLKDQKQIKQFRQKEVKERANQIIALISNYGNGFDKVIMMGHSYGGATIVEAYHSLIESQSKLQNINFQMILLDPWLFPLTQQRLKKNIDIPILMLGNQYFVNRKDVFETNNQFAKANKHCTYMTWKNGDHLHQCDIPFVAGNTPFRKIMHVQKTEYMIISNVKAIQAFIIGIRQQKLMEIHLSEIYYPQYIPAKLQNSLIE